VLYIYIFIAICALIEVAFCLWSYFWNGWGKFAPYVATRGKIKHDILNILGKELKNRKNAKVVDLGSGTGSILISLAKEFQQHEFIGYEWDPILIKISNRKSTGIKNITFKRQNYMKSDLSSFDVVFAYVLKAQSQSVGQKLEKELKKGALIVSEQFPLKHLKEIKRIKSARCGIKTMIYVYRK